jgi:putative Mg2+ transporter-C (MgtC) family protein
MPPLLESDMVWRIAGAALLGACLGFERSLQGKQAGMRTYALTALGAALFSTVGLYLSAQYAEFSGVNPLMLAGYVIVGIGFIGSGLSAMHGDHAELTTATGVWVAAGIGIAAGFGLWGMALGAAILGILVFSVLAKFEHSLRVRWGNRPR